MKKNGITIALTAAAVSLLAVCGRTDAGKSGEASANAMSASITNPDEVYHIDLKFSNVFQPTEWNYKASEKLAKEITEKTDGHVSVTYYGQNQLDCYGDSVTQAVNGENWIGLEEPSLFAEYVGDCAVLIGPMLYENTEEYNYIMDSDVVKEIREKLAGENIHVLDTHYSFGFRNLITNREITKPEDLKGVKMRATSSPLFAKTLEAMGATVKPMSFTDCLEALSSGEVEGFEGSTSTLAGAGAPYELVKNVATTHHLIATRWLFMPEDVYQSIPEKYRKIVDECAADCGKWEQTSCDADEANTINELKEKGVVWNDVEHDAFEAACDPVYDWIVEVYHADPELHRKLDEKLAVFRQR